ncbi:MAG TPA: hypothetical protein VJA18_04130 [Candidatus Nanoarchaeia archaeon]|nr:hypothetical protein [Candidatus Nanoarchaeia archaeon]
MVKKDGVATEVVKKQTLDELLNNNDPRAHKSRATTSGKVHDGASTTLFLGELALGTKACDPRFYQGLAYFLEANGLDQEVGHVVMSGGLLPMIPTFYGVQMAREMVFLGNNWDQEINDLSKMAFRSGVSDEDKDFILKWVAYKITNTSQAVENSRQVIAPLTHLLNDGTVWHYLHGEEDNKNIEMLLEININNYIDTQKAQERDEKKKTGLERELVRLQAKADQYGAQSQLLRNVRQGINPSHDKDTVNTYLASFMKEKKEEIDKLEDPEAFRKFLSSVKSRKAISQRVDKLDTKLKDLRENNRDKSRELKDAINALNARKREMEAPEFHRITGRQHIEPHENELLRMEAKREYQDHLYSSLPGVNVKVHGGNEVDLLLDGVPVTLMHKVQIKSSTPAIAEVNKMRTMMFNRRQQGLPVSDINVSFHGAGGMRAVPVNTKPETIEAYVDRETPRIGMAMQLSTMQSVPYLETLKRKGIKNDHTRRYESGMYSSGAVLYRVEPTGEHSMRMITTEQMLEAYAVGEQIKELKKQASAEKGDGKEKLKEQVKSLEAKLKLRPRRAAIFTDIHLGAPNREGRPSNYELLEAATRYLEKNGWPDDLIINGDIAHGALERHFGSNEQYLARPPSEVSAEVKKIMGSNKSEPEKSAALAHFCQREVSQMLPISVVSLQMREIKYRVVPMIHKTLDKKEDGTVTVTSGNHYNETTHFLDEATDILNAVDMKYLDDPRLREFTGFGERFGMGEATFHETTLEGGWKTYACHGPGNGTDFVQAALKKLFGANKEVNAAYFGHVHIAGAGHAGKTFVTVGAGWQPWVPYVDQLGQQASLRGVTITEHDPSKKGYFGWKFVLDPTLERPEYMGK